MLPLSLPFPFQVAADAAVGAMADPEAVMSSHGWALIIQEAPGHFPEPFVPSSFLPMSRGRATVSTHRKTSGPQPGRTATAVPRDSCSRCTRHCTRGKGSEGTDLLEATPQVKA